jgi:DNA-binding CsgD family transcriptional regulator
LTSGCAAYFLVGEPGTGKTRLAREILRALESTGAATARAIATESSRHTPLAALAHLIPTGAADDPASLFHSTRTALSAELDGRTITIHVDDAHHLDPSSAALLASLADAGAAQLVVTMRAGTAIPDSLAALQDGDGARTTVVDALDAISVDTLLHRVLGAPLDGATEAQLVETSGGNPLFLRELVLGAVSDGALREVEGVWRLDGTLVASRALGERVLGRVTSLAEDARSALELIAVGEPIGLGDLEALVEPAVLEVLEARGLIRVEPDGRRNDTRLAHPAYGEILRADIGRVRLRRLAREHAERVARHGARRRSDALQIARWQIDAGITPDADVVLAGARIARHSSDWISTQAMARAALDAGAAQAAPLLAEALFELGHFDELAPIVDTALAAQPPDAESFVQLSRTKALGLFWGHDRADDALAVLVDAEARVDAPEHAELLQFARASLLTWSGNPLRALELVEPLLGSEEPRVAVQAALVVQLAAATMGPTDRAVALADEWFPIHLSLPDLVGTSSPGNHILTKALALTNAGQLEEAAALADLGYGASVANRSLIGQMWFSLQLGRIALVRGDANLAARWFREQIALCRDTGHRRPITLGLSGLAIACAYLGDEEGARAALTEMDATPSAVIELLAIEGARARAWALVAAGDVGRACAELTAGAEEAEARGIVLMGALARLDAVRLGDRSQANALAAASATCASELVDLVARWSSSPDDPAELESIAEQLEALGCLLFAAEATATAADLWRSRSEPRRAAAAEQHADELARRCRGASTPALTTIDTLVPLTAREREIALLVAQGLTSKQVAERLFVSARTVSNHLQNAYVKLGISKRSELAEALGRLGELGDANDSDDPEADG